MCRKETQEQLYQEARSSLLLVCVHALHYLGLVDPVGDAYRFMTGGQAALPFQMRKGDRL